MQCADLGTPHRREQRFLSLFSQCFKEIQLYLTAPLKYWWREKLYIFMANNEMLWLCVLQRLLILFDAQHINWLEENYMENALHSDFGCLDFPSCMCMVIQLSGNEHKAIWYIGVGKALLCFTFAKLRKLEGWKNIFPWVAIT